MQFEHLDLHNKVYAFWRNFWTRVLEKNRSPHSLKIEDFFRQDLIGVLLHDGEPIGLHCSTYFNLNQTSAIDHPYFSSSFSGDYLKFLHAENKKVGLTIEYLTIDEAWRKQNFKYSLAEVLIGLHVELFKKSQADCIVAVARTDLKVHKMADKFGYSVIGEEVIKHNTPCALITCSKEETREHPDVEVSEHISKLWGQHLDLREVRPERKLKLVA